MVNDFSDYARPAEFKEEEIEIINLLQEGVDLFSNMNFGNKIKMDIKNKSSKNSW